MSKFDQIRETEDDLPEWASAPSLSVTFQVDELGVLPLHLADLPHDAGEGHGTDLGAALALEAGEELVEVLLQHHVTLKEGRNLQFMSMLDPTICTARRFFWPTATYPTCAFIMYS